MTDHTPRYGAAVSTVMFGQEWEGPDGVMRVAAEDSVRLDFVTDGQALASRLQSAEQAIELAKSLMAAAGTIIAASIDDQGDKAGLLDRLARFNEAWKAGS